MARLAQSIVKEEQLKKNLKVCVMKFRKGLAIIRNLLCTFSNFRIHFFPSSHFISGKGI
jgi:hypothetical protein